LDKINSKKLPEHVKAEIEKDFSQWLKDHINEVPVAAEQIQEILKERTW